MRTGLRYFLFIVCVLLITALFAVSKEIFPPGNYIGGLVRIVVVPLLLWAALLGCKKFAGWLRW